MILSLQEAKQFLRINTKEFDTLIEMYIPIVQREIIERTNNRFKDENIQLCGAGISFLDDEINDSNAQFIIAGFKEGMDIVVEGSRANDYVFELGSVTANKLTLNLPNTETLIDESAQLFVTITRVKFPAQLKLIAVKILKHYLNNEHGRDVTSESIGSVSQSFTAYNDEITKDLTTYVKMGF